MARSAATATPMAVADRLRPLLVRINRRLRRELRDLDISGVQVSLLGAIRQNPGIGQAELAGREGMSAASLSNHIDRLEQRGLVERSKSSSADRRRVGLHISPAGEELLETIRTRRTLWLAQGLRELDSADLAAIEAAIEPLRRLLEATP